MYSTSGFLSKLVLVVLFVPYYVYAGLNSDLAKLSAQLDSLPILAEQTHESDIPEAPPLEGEVATVVAQQPGTVKKVPRPPAGPRPAKPTPKPPPPRETVPPSSTSFREQLLKDIREGNKLRPVVQEPKTVNKGGPKTFLEEIPEGRKRLKPPSEGKALPAGDRTPEGKTIPQEPASLENVLSKALEKYRQVVAPAGGEEGRTEEEGLEDWD